jgi:hypothetical protein
MKLLQETFKDPTRRMSICKRSRGVKKWNAEKLNFLSQILKPYFYGKNTLEV